MNTFAGKVALVTGGSSGIGRAAAVKFGEQGAKIVVAARREKEGNETVEMIKKAGGEAMFVQTDVRIASQVENMVQKTVKKYGRLDIAFNNAGVGSIMARMIRTTEELFDEVVDTNFKGVCRGIHRGKTVRLQRKQTRRRGPLQGSGDRVWQGQHPSSLHLPGMDQNRHD